MVNYVFANVFFLKKRIFLMHKIKNFFKLGGGELLIIFALLFILNNFIGYEKITIKSDGEGYYDYLPALFIYKDFPNNLDSDNYSDRINNLGCYIKYKELKVNKYPCGTAVLLSPFFVFANLTATIQGYEKEGFSITYQKAVLYAAFFYLFLALFFLKKLLILYKIKRGNIFFVQIFTVFSTSLIQYVYSDAAFSHVYSFFAITAFLFLTKSYFINNITKTFLWACFFLGLIIILRQINCIIVLFIPFIAGSSENFKNGIKNLFCNKLTLFIGISVIFSIVFIQLFLWHYQTGSFFIYSYQGEGFNFLSPAFLKILISYRKGLFVYTPIVFLSLLGLYIFIKNKNYYQILSWLLFFIFLTYILSSWHSWEYGCSYGLRAYIDFYSVFFILLALLIESTKRWLKITIFLISFLTIPINLIQTKQYKEFILDWQNMDKHKYWTVFLKLDDRFKGLVWKRNYTFNSQTTKIKYSKIIPNIRIEPNFNKQIYVEYTNNINEFDKVNIIQVSFYNEFDSKQDAIIDLAIKDSLSNESYYYHNPPLIHFNETGLNQYQYGEYNYELGSINKENSKKIILTIYTRDKEVVLKNLKINFIEYQN